MANSDRAPDERPAPSLPDHRRPGLQALSEPPAARRPRRRRAERGAAASSAAPPTARARQPRAVALRHRPQRGAPLPPRPGPAPGRPGRRGSLVPRDPYRGPEDLASDAPTPEDTVSLGDLADRVFAAVPADERRAVILHDIEGHTLREVADLEGISPTAHARYQRGLAMLRSAAAEEDSRALDSPPAGLLDRALRACRRAVVAIGIAIGSPSGALRSAGPGVRGVPVARPRDRLLRSRRSKCGRFRNDGASQCGARGGGATGRPLPRGARRAAGAEGRSARNGVVLRRQWMDRLSAESPRGGVRRNMIPLIGAALVAAVLALYLDQRAERRAARASTAQQQARIADLLEALVSLRATLVATGAVERATKLPPSAPAEAPRSIAPQVAVPLPSVERKLVSVTRDDDPVHTRATVEAPAPDGWRPPRTRLSRPPMRATTPSRPAPSRAPARSAIAGEGRASTARARPSWTAPTRVPPWRCLATTSARASTPGDHRLMRRPACARSARPSTTGCSVRPLRRRPSPWRSLRRALR